MGDSTALKQGWKIRRGLVNAGDQRHNFDQVWRVADHSEQPLLPVTNKNLCALVGPQSVERLQGISRSLLNHLHVVAKQRIKIGHREEHIELIEQYKGQILEHIYLFVNFKCEKSLRTCVKIDRFLYVCIYIYIYTYLPPKKDGKFFIYPPSTNLKSCRLLHRIPRSLWCAPHVLPSWALALGAWVVFGKAQLDPGGGERPIHAWGLSTNVHLG